MAIWTFSTLANAGTTAQTATNEVLVGTPSVQQFYQNIDNSGTSGQSYTDLNSTSHTSTNAISWTDIKGTGTDAELFIKFNSTGWSAINLRFDYKSRSADGFDIEYSLNNGSSWNLVTTQSALTDGFSWQSKTLNFSGISAINDANSVIIRFSKFDVTGNDELVFDNIELSGSPIVEIPGTPYIYIDTVNNTDFLNLKRRISGYASSVISDPTDPAHTKGIHFLLRDANTALNTLTLTASSTNTTVVPNSNLSLSIINDSIRKLNILPISVGYSDITLTVSDGTNSNTYILRYAASAASLYPSLTDFHTGFSDASSVVDAGNNFRLVCDDETNYLYLVHKDSSGYFQKSFDMASPMGLVLEGDFEASFRKNNRSYWIGSLGNSESGNLRPDRYKFFAADISGSGINTNVAFVGAYDMRNSVISWGDANGYNFTASAASGMIPKQIDGFNVEGMALGPDSTSMYIGFRAPLVPLSGPNPRSKALICKVLNFETWFNNGSPIGAPTYGSPIELDLGGRSIRSMEKTASGEYLIVAGDYDSGLYGFALYEWGGNQSDVPVLLTANLSDLNPEGIIVLPNPILNGSVVELLSDDGSNFLYNDGIESKSLPANEHKKFRTQTIATSGATGTICVNSTNTVTQSACSSYSLNGQIYNSTGTYTQLLSNAAGCDSTLTLSLTIIDIDTTVSLNGTTITAVPGAIYQWINCDNSNLPISGETSQSFTPAVNGNYAVEITLNGCSEISACTNVLISGSNVFDLSKVVVYPNPTKDKILIDFGSDLQFAELSVYAMNGKLLNKINTQNSRQISISLENYTAGLYFIEIKTKEGNFSVLKVSKL